MAFKRTQRDPSGGTEAEFTQPLGLTAQIGEFDARRSYSGGGRLKVPQHLIPKDEEWEFKRHTCHGADEDGNMTEQVEQGWVPVHSSECPQLAGKTFDPEKGIVTDGALVRRGGLILCKRPKIYSDIIRQKMNEDSRMMEAALDDHGGGAYDGRNFVSSPATRETQIERRTGPGQAQVVTTSAQRQAVPND